MSGGGHGKRREMHEEHEEHENHERWLVSYADMVTLLFVLFVVMFAISQVDQKKFQQLATGLASGFGAPVTFMAGGSAMLDPGGAIAPDSVNINGAARDAETTTKTPEVDPAAVAQLVRATSKAQVAAEAAKLDQARKQLEAALAQAGLKDSATFKVDERGLVVTIATDDVLFDSGAARLRLTGRTILDALAPTLKKVPNRLSVDGHTNSLPIRSAAFPSNWELSTTRATNVLRYLVSEHGLPATKLSATGYADTRPLRPNSTPQGLAVNRRVEIVVLAQLDDSAGRALAALADEKDASARARAAAARTAEAKAAAADAAAKKAEAAKATAADLQEKAETARREAELAAGG